MTTWKFAEEKPRVGAESALDACDYFVDEVIEPWKVPGTVDSKKKEFFLNFTSGSVSIVSF